MEVGERTVDDADVLTHLVLDGDLGRGRLAADPDDVADLVLLQRDRLVARADEGGDPRRIAHHVPGLVAHDHVDQDVAGEDPPGHAATLSVLDLDDILRGDQHIEDLVVHVHRLDTLEQVRPDLFLVSGVGMDDEPLGVWWGCRRLGGGRLGRHRRGGVCHGNRVLTDGSC